MSAPPGKKDDEKVHMGCLAPGTYPHSTDPVFGEQGRRFPQYRTYEVSSLAAHSLELTQKSLSSGDLVESTLDTTSIKIKT
jgi:hypothetical protein